MQDFMEVGIGYLAVGMPVIIVFIVFYFKYQESKNKHDALIEMSKNINDPAQLKELLQSLEVPQKPVEIKKSGLILIFIGIGLYCFGTFFLGDILKGVGLLVSFIGLGMLLAGFFFPKKKKIY